MSAVDLSAVRAVMGALEADLACECRPGCIWSADTHCATCDKHVAVCACVVPCECGAATASTCRCSTDSIFDGVGL